MSGGTKPQQILLYVVWHVGHESCKSMLPDLGDISSLIENMKLPLVEKMKRLLPRMGFGTVTSD